MDNKIRILHLIYSFAIEGTGGGAGRFTLALSKSLSPDHFEITVCGLWETNTGYDGLWIDHLRQQGINAFTATHWDEKHPYRSFYRAVQKLRNYISKQKTDIIHSQSEFGDVVALLLKSKKAPIIIRTIHNGHHLEWRKRPLRRILLTNTFYPLFFSSEIGINHDVTNHLNNRWLSKITNRKSICIHNGLEFDRFQEVSVNQREVRHFLDIPLSADVVGTIGRLVEGKGFDVLLDAAVEILNKLPEVYFIFIGGGELLEPLKFKAIQLGINKKVVFTGPRSDIEHLLSIIDIFVCPSLWEGIPTVVLESMASGVPVVASDIPGNREIIDHNINGWLFEVNSVEALSQGVINALEENSNNRQLIISNARKRVDDFSIEKIALQYEQLYLEKYRNLYKSE